MNDKELQETEKRIRQLRVKMAYVKGKERQKIFEEYEKLMFGDSE